MPLEGIEPSTHNFGRYHSSTELQRHCYSSCPYRRFLCRTGLSVICFSAVALLNLATDAGTSIRSYSTSHSVLIIPWTSVRVATSAPTVCRPHIALPPGFEPRLTSSKGSRATVTLRENKRVSGTAIPCAALTPPSPTNVCTLERIRTPTSRSRAARPAKLDYKSM